jgi:hypothetical protein
VAALVCFAAAVFVTGAAFFAGAFATGAVCEGAASF